MWMSVWCGLWSVGTLYRESPTLSLYKVELIKDIKFFFLLEIAGMIISSFKMNKLVWNYVKWCLLLSLPDNVHLVGSLKAFFIFWFQYSTLKSWVNNWHFGKHLDGNPATASELFPIFHYITVFWMVCWTEGEIIMHRFLLWLS